MSIKPAFLRIAHCFSLLNRSNLNYSQLPHGRFEAGKRKGFRNRAVSYLASCLAEQKHWVKPVFSIATKLVILILKWTFYAQGSWSQFVMNGNSLPCPEKAVAEATRKSPIFLAQVWADVHRSLNYIDYYGACQEEGNTSPEYCRSRPVTQDEICGSKVYHVYGKNQW